MSEEVPAMPGVDPMAVIVIQNNVLLHQLIGKVEKVAEKQETNHLVAVALTEHKTIDKVEQLWTGFGNLRFLMWVVAGLLSLIPIVATVLTITHFVVRWP